MRRQLCPLIVFFSLSSILMAQGPPAPTKSFRLAFASHAAGKKGIYVARTDGSPAVRLTRGEFDMSPCWAPDGTKIAFLSARGDDDIEALRKHGSMFMHFAYVTKNGIDAVKIDEGRPLPVARMAGAWQLSSAALASKER